MQSDIKLQAVPRQKRLDTLLVCTDIQGEIAMIDLFKNC